MRILVAISLMSVALAGCTGSTPADETPGSPDGDEPRMVLRPLWAVGDWWTFDFGGSQITWVITEDAGDAWILDVDNADLAFEHAAFAQTSTIGEVSKDHLDGSQEDGPVHFFDFPLIDGKTWETTWDGMQFSAEAQITADLVKVEYSRGDQVARTVVYDEEKGWFRSMVSVDENGTEQWRADLRQSGANYAGEYVRWTIHDDIEEARNGVGQITRVQFEVPDVHGIEMWYRVDIWCNPDGIEGDQGAYYVQIGPEGGTARFGPAGNCPNSIAENGVWTDLEPGQWALVSTLFGGSFDARLILRTVETFSMQA